MSLEEQIPGPKILVNILLYDYGGNHHFIKWVPDTLGNESEAIYFTAL